MTPFFEIDLFLWSFTKWKYNRYLWKYYARKPKTFVNISDHRYLDHVFIWNLAILSSVLYISTMYLLDRYLEISVARIIFWIKSSHSLRSVTLKLFANPDSCISATQVRQWWFSKTDELLYKPARCEEVAIRYFSFNPGWSRSCPTAAARDKEQFTSL